MNVTLRPPTADDAPECGRIIHQAFTGIAERHGFLPDVPSLEMGLGLVSSFIANPEVFGVVAESDGKIVGSIFLDERDAIRGLGPITVDPNLQQHGVGRLLMQAAIDRGKDALGIRLMQDAFNVLSMSLYASLGFNVREPLLLMAGKTKSLPSSDYEVRPLESQDLDECAALCRSVHCFDRANELGDALNLYKPFVVLREGRIKAYASAPTIFWAVNHGVAQSDEDMQALLSGAALQNEQPLSFLLPTRQAEFYRWCLREGLRAVNPRTLMSMGEYQEPKGCFFPSVLY